MRGKKALAARCLAALAVPLLAGACAAAASTTAAAGPKSSAASSRSSAASGSASDPSSSPNFVTASDPYWTLHRLSLATPLTSWHHTPQGQSTTSLQAPRVGALFFKNLSGGHFCTASVVDSPAGNLLITAAHCVTGTNTDIVFVPDYRSGSDPYGIWQPATVVVNPRWTKDSDPDLDVAFVVLKPLNGKHIANILGANKVGINQGATNEVRVTGYPASSDTPITCSGETKPQSATQMEFDCDGYATGTSGSPWVTGFDPTTHEGTVVGVIGGYQQGGSTPDISYSPYFGADIANLYQLAIKDGG